MRGQAALIVVLGAAVACESASPESGLQAWLTVAEAQWAQGDMPAGTDGPAVTSVHNARTSVWPGQRDKAVTGTLTRARAARAVALALTGDQGHWILPAGPPDPFAPGEWSFAARLAFAATLPTGPRALIVRAVGADGRFGAAWREEILVASPDEVVGALVVSLRWDTNADLDLHVVDPAGVEIWARNINSYQPPPPGQAEDPEAFRQGGILDHDSNAGCLIDGRRRERVIWSGPPPPGRYTVRVDPAALCGQPAARFQVEVWREGESVARAGGTLVEAQFQRSVQQGAGKGSGLFVLTFDQPASP